MAVTADIAQRVRDREQWYHTLELVPGEQTPGWFDLRAVADKVLPERVDGLRCLDVGTFDGFWAFELERRGAAEVLGVDIVDPLAWDWPVNSGAAIIEAHEARKQGGLGFHLAAEALGSSATWAECSVYDLDPEVHGQFDVVFMGSLLLHLRDPVRALERLRSVCRGIVVTMDAVDPIASVLLPRRPMATLDGNGRPWWWLPNVAGYKRMVQAAGLQVVKGPHYLGLPPGPGQPRRKPSRAQLSHREGRRLLWAQHLGDPHAVMHARPA